MTGLRHHLTGSTTPEQDALGGRLWRRVRRGSQINMNEQLYLILLGAVQKLNRSRHFKKEPVAKNIK